MAFKLLYKQNEVFSYLDQFALTFCEKKQMYFNVKEYLRLWDFLKTYVFSESSCSEKSENFFDYNKGFFITSQPSFIYGKVPECQVLDYKESIKFYTFKQKDYTFLELVKEHIALNSSIFVDGLFSQIPKYLVDFNKAKPHHDWDKFLLSSTREEENIFYKRLTDVFDQQFLQAYFFVMLVIFQNSFFIYYNDPNIKKENNLGIKSIGDLIQEICSLILNLYNPPEKNYLSPELQKQIKISPIEICSIKTVISQIIGQVLICFLTNLKLQYIVLEEENSIRKLFDLKCFKIFTESFCLTEISELSNEKIGLFHKNIWKQFDFKIKMLFENKITKILDEQTNTILANSILKSQKINMNIDELSKSKIKSFAAGNDVNFLYKTEEYKKSWTSRNILLNLAGFKSKSLQKKIENNLLENFQVLNSQINHNQVDEAYKNCISKDFIRNLKLQKAKLWIYDILCFCDPDCSLEFVSFRLTLTIIDLILPYFSDQIFHVNILYEKFKISKAFELIPKINNNFVFIKYLDNEINEDKAVLCSEFISKNRKALDEFKQSKWTFANFKDLMTKLKIEGSKKIEEHEHEVDRQISSSFLEYINLSLIDKPDSLHILAELKRFIDSLDFDNMDIITFASLLKQISIFEKSEVVLCFKYFIRKKFELIKNKKSENIYIYFKKEIKKDFKIALDLLYIFDKNEETNKIVFVKKFEDISSIKSVNRFIYEIVNKCLKKGF